MDDIDDSRTLNANRPKVRHVITLPKGYEKAQFWSGHKGIILATAPNVPMLEIDLHNRTMKIFEVAE